jgi:hypothetical protein
MGFHYKLNKSCIWWKEIMTEEVLQSMRIRQINNLKEALLCLHRAVVYKTLDSSLALDGQIDCVMSELEYIIKNESV